METCTHAGGCGPKQMLRDSKVWDLVVHKRRLVEVPHVASLAETMNTLVANCVLAVPVSAPPGHFIGAGGSMIMESDERTGAARKQYIGIVTMLDILAHIGGGGGVYEDVDDEKDLHRKMAAPVTAVIGHCIEGLSLWTLSPNTSVLESMELLSKGIHRVLVPLDCNGHDAQQIHGAEVEESSHLYRLLTQTDVVKFLEQHSLEMGSVTARSVRDLRAVNRQVFAITDKTKLVDAIRCMRAGLINAVPIVASEEHETDHSLLIEGRGRKILGTFSATDLRGCHLSTLKTWLPISALDFTEKISKSPLYPPSGEGPRPREPVTCTDESSLAEVMERAMAKHVHRVWVVEDDDQGLLDGVVSLTDMIRVVRVAVLSA
ncbi:hypothetical protein MLD38_030662 [Melastoma candidum]|uniref:Uncharacterized protein n=1 Tax=Melastoma candidum TaxID=119954 RepID=A0ACB9MNI0_9MYRT|nr:hypothetical protein MLD38_030662 [Melastoma candidum]